MKEEVKDLVRQIVMARAEQLTDKQLLVEVNSKLNQDVSLGFIRKVRQNLGIKKAPGRGVCKILDKPEKLSEVLAVNREVDSIGLDWSPPEETVDYSDGQESPF